MIALLLKSSRRFYLRHPWQLALAITGIALGVAVYVGVDLANDSARRAFTLSTEALRGQTTHRLLPVGGLIPERVFGDLLTAGAVERAAPVVEINVRLGGPRGDRHVLLGIDPLAESGFRDYSSYAGGGALDWQRLIAVPATVFLPRGLAGQLGLGPGDVVGLWLAGRRAEVEIAGLLGDATGALQGAPPIVADISTAQELAGAVGSLTRIDLRLDTAQAQALGGALPPSTTLVPAGSEQAALDEMMEAFRINLTALGLLALLVGMFLIYSTMSFSIVQRKPSISILRALGVDGRGVVVSVLFEALVLGAIGTLLGLALGHGLASFLVDMVLRTIGDLYFNRALQQGAASTLIDLRGLALGLGVTLVAAVAPALDAAHGDQSLLRAAVEAKSRLRAQRAALAAMPTLLAAAAVLMLGSGLLAGFVAMFLVLSAGALLTPLGTLVLMRLLQPAASRCCGLSGSLAVRGVTASLSRTGVAVAALGVAVASVIGVGLMIESFRGSLIRWLDTTLTADLYVTLPADAMAEQAPALDALRALPEVEGISLSRALRLPTRLGELGLRATEPGPEGYGLDLVAGDIANLDARPDAIAVAEPLAYRLGLEVGTEIELPTSSDPVSFEVVAVYRDYTSVGNDLVIDLGSYRRHWSDATLTGIGVHLRRGAESGAAASAVARLLGLADDRIRSTEAIERISIAIFDRTFEITEVLRWLAGLIAFLGVLSAVLAIQLERARERAILRGLGFSPRGLASLVLVQTGLLGLSASLAAIPLGAGLAALLVHVINRRSFGWTMELSFTAQPLALGVLLAVTASLLAGLYPAWQASRADLGEALRDE